MPDETSDAMKAANLRPAAMKPEAKKPQWQAPLLWRAVQRFARIIIPIFCRIRITGDVPAELKRGPLILAGNHIANCDPMIMTAATARAGLAPRMMATGGLLVTANAGPMSQSWGLARSAVTLARYWPRPVIPLS